MPGYLVTMYGDAREVYYVEAEDAETAAQNWSSGQLEIQESFGMDVDSVEEVDY